mmetsp:Transcript_64963/g.186931  ORF Transcript_64963/g.186931 Transcript_64963/m.186931 type:complete len:401 (-) Transcript_64963:136-1338(-)
MRKWSCTRCQKAAIKQSMQMINASTKEYSQRYRHHFGPVGTTLLPNQAVDCSASSRSLSAATTRDIKSVVFSSWDFPCILSPNFLPMVPMLTPSFTISLVSFSNWSASSFIFFSNFSSGESSSSLSSEPPVAFVIARSTSCSSLLAFRTTVVVESISTSSSGSMVPFFFKTSFSFSKSFSDSSISCSRSWTWVASFFASSSVGRIASGFFSISNSLAICFSNCSARATAKFARRLISSSQASKVAHFGLVTRASSCLRRSSIPASCHSNSPDDRARSRISRVLSAISWRNSAALSCIAFNCSGEGFFSSTGGVGKGSSSFPNMRLARGIGSPLIPKMGLPSLLRRASPSRMRLPSTSKGSPSSPTRALAGTLNLGAPSASKMGLLSTSRSARFLGIGLPS